MSGAFPQWTGGMYPLPERWVYKRDIPKDVLCRSVSVRRLDFGLYGVRWVVWTQHGLLMPDGSEMRTHETWLRTGGHRIGPRDASVAANTAWAYEWQRSLGDDNLRRCGIMPPDAAEGKE